MTRRAWSCAAALALSGCGPAVPGGQVLAVVNGHDVTMRDLTGTGSGQGAPDKAMLGQVIDRHLLAEEALARGIDRSPEYLASLRSLREQLLVQALGRQLVAAAPPVTPGDVDAYIAAHPHSFGERLQAELTDGAAGPRFTLDTVDLTPAQARQLATRKPGDAFRYGAEEYTVAALRKAPIAGNDARSYAAEAITAERLRAQFQRLLTEKRASASILYQNGLGPAPK